MALNPGVAGLTLNLMRAGPKIARRPKVPLTALYVDSVAYRRVGYEQGGALPRISIPVRSIPANGGQSGVDPRPCLADRLRSVQRVNFARGFFFC